MSQPIDDGGPAFPQPLAFNPNGDAVTPGMYFPDVSGMPLRDWFAGQASEQDIEHHMTPGYAAGRIIVRTREQAKYAYADAMLAARKGGDQ